MLGQAAAVLFAATIAASSAWAGAPLADFKGRSRVLIVSSPAATDPSLVKQTQWLRTDGPGLRERDVVVIRIVGGVVEAPSDRTLTAQSVRGAVGLPSARFGVALVGKDGSVALRQGQPITTRTLFAAIDAMPMRREEMRARRL